jgi:hypothetical protein
MHHHTLANDVNPSGFDSQILTDFVKHIRPNPDRPTAIEAGIQTDHVRPSGFVSQILTENDKRGWDPNVSRKAVRFRVPITDGNRQAFDKPQHSTN